MSEHASSRSWGQQESGGAGEQSAARSPGKQTLVEQSAPIQQRAEGAGAAEGPGDVRELAGKGTKTASSSLPYFDVIQAAFGHHDISGLVAHTDGEAGETAKGMGAKGYTAGKHVVLGPGADLFTVAHEAAHFIEQQHGLVSLPGGVGAVGDIYEQHADEVAGMVVAGQSVEGLLDQYVGKSGGTKAGGGADSGPVQHQLFGGQTDVGRKQQELVPQNLERARAFERKLGVAAFKDQRAQDAATEMVKRMLAAVIPGFDDQNAGQQAQYGALFGRENKDGTEHAKDHDNGAWSSGQVGTDFGVLREALENGNLRERMTGVYNAAFGGFKTEMNQLMHADRDTIKSRGVDDDKLKRRRNQTKFPFTETNLPGRDLYRSPGDLLDRKHATSAYEITGNTRLTNGAEEQKTKRKVGDLDGEGIGLSDREKAFQFGEEEIDGDTPLRWKEGGTRFRPNDDNKWVKKYQEKLLMPVTAGPSGTALRIFQAWEFLGKPVANVDLRLALLGWMLTGNDHSFHEIMVTSSTYGMPYAAGVDAYREVAPFTEAELRAIAGAEGFPDEGNYRAQHLPSKDPQAPADAAIPDPVAVFTRPAHVAKVNERLTTDPVVEATNKKDGRAPLQDLRQFPKGELGQMLALILYTDDRNKPPGGGISVYQFINTVLKNDPLMVPKLVGFMRRDPQLMEAWNANKFSIKELIAEARQHAKYTKEGMKKMAPFTGEVFRGNKTSTLPVVGTSWTERKFTSMSHKRHVSEGYAQTVGSGNYMVLVKMECVSGRKISAASMFAAEGEILFAPGTGFEITKVEPWSAPGVTNGYEVTWTERPAADMQPVEEAAELGGGAQQGEAQQGGVDDITPAP